MKVFLSLNPQAMISLAFLKAYLWQSSNDKLDLNSFLILAELRMMD
jgi:hypothetical protein